MLLNPMARSLSASMTKMIKHKVLSHLVNEDETREYYKQMFEEDEEGWVPAERTLHKAIPPADVRIQNFKRKDFKDYERVVSEVKRRDDKMYNDKMSTSYDNG